MKVASLFTGIGGFDLGFERAGYEIVLQVEVDRSCNLLLQRKWPDVRRLKDVRTIGTIGAVDVVCGGDPCQSRSSAKGGRKSLRPDLSGYFLSIIGRSSARWVVRENVCSSDVSHFATGLELLGYRVVVIELDARDFTAQSRRRQFVVGCPFILHARFKKVLSDAASDFRDGKKSIKEKSQVAACITAHPCRISDSDTLIYENEKGLRFFTEGEAEALQGFPGGWTAGFSRTRRFIFLGEAVPPPMTEWIARRIIEAENGEMRP